MKGRTTAVVAVCAAAVLAAGVIVWRPRSEPPPPDTPAEPTVRVNVTVSDHDTDRGWFLMAPQEVADRTPPADVVDCRGLHAWALREGALPVGDAAHTITLSADRRTTIESTYVRIVPDPTPYPGDDRAAAPVVRLRCLPEPAATPPLTRPDRVDFAVNGDAAPRTFPERHEVGPGEDARFDVVVDLTGTTGPFAYRVEVGVVEGGGFRMVPVNDGDDVFFATEDGGGMGYRPATTTWTMHPVRTRTACPPMTDPGPEVTCS
ncbi:hypothetical protein ACWEFJ_36665 [Actinosynnema sp. NPDC004786]